VRGHRDLKWVCVAAVVAALVACLVPWDVVRLLAALPLAIFLPGYAITAAAFGPQRLDPQRLAMLTLLCGLSLLCLGGIVLNFLPGGLRTVTWALLLLLVVIAAARATALRRSRPDGRASGWTRPRLRGIDIACVVLAAFLAVGTLVFAYTPLPASKAVGYTALWMLPAKDAADPALKVGVISAEHGRRHYRLEARIGENGKPKRYHLALDPGEERVVAVPVNAPAGKRRHVVVSLYDSDRPHKLYRRVNTWTVGSQPGEG
jgi:Protein of unknown function (DUF1616)